MRARPLSLPAPGLSVSTALSVAVSAAIAVTVAGATPAHAGGSGHGPGFDPLPHSATCTKPGGDPDQPLVLPKGFRQKVLASEPDFPDLPDMNVVNETGPQAGRWLYRTHETATNAAVSVTDLGSGKTRVLVQRADWERFDGLAWTPWGTLLAGEEVVTAAQRDPDVPKATSGLVYEIDPGTGKAVPRPALGSLAHEGIRLDSQGNVYVIDEYAKGSIYRFVPDRRGDLSKGRLYALRITTDAGDRTGQAEWVPLDQDGVQVSARDQAAAVKATTYNRPEDVEVRGKVLYVAITGENRVLGVQLGKRPLVFDYVRAGVNAPTDFSSPDNLASDRAGNLYITEDPGGEFPAKKTGDDIWVATGKKTRGQAASVARFASLTDCDAEPTGIYFSPHGAPVLYVNIQHRGGDGRDKALVISRS